MRICTNCQQEMPKYGKKYCYDCRPKRKKRISIEDVVLEEGEYFERIKGVETNYHISNYGRILSPKCFSKISTNTYGYSSVYINNGTKIKKYLLHRLLAIQFIENDDPDNKIYVDHINRDPSDNRLENLRWITPSGNSRNADRIDNRMGHISQLNIRSRGKLYIYYQVVSYPEDTTQFKKYVNTFKDRHKACMFYLKN